MSTGQNRLELVEQQQAITSRALRHILEGRWTGELPHAAADVVELLGGPNAEAAQGFAPVDFPAPKAGAELGAMAAAPSSELLTSATGCRGMGPGDLDQNPP